MKNYFKSISTKYDSLRGEGIQAPLSSILEKLTSKHSKVLDVACGTGLFLTPIATKFDFEFYGADMSSSMLETAYKKAKNKDLRVKFLNSDVHCLPFKDGYFDVLISTNAIHHFDLIKSLNECARVLKEGGSYVVFSRFREQNDRSFWGKNFPKFASKEDRLYYRKEFEEIAEKIEKFELESIKEHSFERKSTKDEILDFAANKKYSTFDLYGDKEFEDRLNSFKKWLNAKKDIVYTAEIGEVIFKKV